MAMTRPTMLAGEHSWIMPHAMGVHVPNPIPMRATSTVAITRSCVQTRLQRAAPPITLETETAWTRFRMSHCVNDTSPRETKNKPIPNQDQRYPTSTGPNASIFFPKTGKSVVKAPVPNVYTDAIRIRIRMVRWETSAYRIPSAKSRYIAATQLLCLGDVTLRGNRIGTRHSADER